VNRRELTGDAPEIAVRLLGARLAVGEVVVRVVEVEAYGGPDDEASHAFRGPRVANRTMFGPPGHLYVYLSYGLHSCANVVCGRPGSPGAVLLRAADVLEGAAVVRARRGRGDRRGRLAGPGTLCQGLGIDRRLDGVDLCDETPEVRVEFGTIESDESVVTGPRIGISRAVERPWRFRLIRPPACVDASGDPC
jgi:DNA-3-methyladenine glycosylase